MTSGHFIFFVLFFAVNSGSTYLLVAVRHKVSSSFWQSQRKNKEKVGLLRQEKDLNLNYLTLQCKSTCLPFMPTPFYNSVFQKNMRDLFIRSEIQIWRKVHCLETWSIINGSTEAMVVWAPWTPSRYFMTVR